MWYAMLRLQGSTSGDYLAANQPCLVYFPKLNFIKHPLFSRLTGNQELSCSSELSFWETSEIVPTNCSLIVARTINNK